MVQLDKDGTPPRLSRLTPAQRASFEKRIKLGGESTAVRPRIGRRLDLNAASFPSSFAQERLWFLSELLPGDTAYHIPAVVRFRERLDVELLMRVIEEIARRHEILRTCFRYADGQLVQTVEPFRPFPIKVDDLAAEGELAEETAWSLMREEMIKPFDLAKVPLFRIRIFRLAPNEQLVFMMMHHIISDGWSMRVLKKEISSLYLAFSTGQPSSLPALPIQYADYSVWQRNWLRGSALNEQVSYWRGKLLGASILEVPTDRPRPPVQSSRGAETALEVPKSLTTTIVNHARSNGITLFMFLLAAFQVVLLRWSGQDDIVVGIPIAGRTDPDTEKLIGFFVNTLVLRTSLAGDPTFLELLARVKEVTLGAYAHQDLPFEKLIEVLQPIRDLSRSPLFQVLINSHELEVAQVDEFDELFEPAAPTSSDTVNSKFDLTLYLYKRDSALHLHLMYNTDVFDKSSMETLLRHYLSVLEAVSDDATKRLSAISLLAREEHHRVLIEWNDTDREFANEKSIHELFSEQAAKTPTAVAVIFEDQKLTYRDLDRESSRLAAALRGAGVGPEAVVGLSLERSVGMVVGLLGILKAGGAYLPLDPAYPHERVAYMLDDSNACAIVTTLDQKVALSDFGVKLILLDAEAATTEPEKFSGGGSGAGPSNLAYIIYTSGSTGLPKGVMVEHRQVLNYVFGIRKTLPFGGAKNFAMLQSLTVGSAITVLYPSLLFGACLHIVGRHRALDAQSCGEYFALHNVDCVKVAPSHLAALVDASQSPADLVRDMVIVAGEPMPTKLLERLLIIKPGARIFNHYGTTETTIGVLTNPTGATKRQDPASVPLGRPLPNCRIYILDHDLNLLPPGLIGEIHVAGSHLTRGYLRDPNLTAQRYIPNPFASGQLLYRTGDLGRWLSDGTIQFVGRRDNQIKVRGFRVELGEVESCLSSHPGVSQALVSARTISTAETQLNAYVVLEGAERRPTSAEIMQHIKLRLPDYMVPNVIVIVDQLPRTPHGKSDRRALASLDNRLSYRKEHVAPQNDTQKMIARIWRTILRRDDFGINDNFFDLGGHSLLATRVIVHLREAFGSDLPLRVLFDAPTIAELEQLLAPPDEEVLFIEVNCQE